MAQMDNREGRKRALDRLMFFSDAVAAIAATLLILPLVDDASAIGHRSVGDLLSDNWHALFAFALSFAVIYRFWIIHHHLYENVSDYSQPLLWANGLWLICIVFLPFPTELIGTGTENGRSPLGLGLYIGTMVVASAASMLAQWIIQRSPNLATPGAPRRSLSGAAIATAALVVAFIVAVAYPPIGPWALLILVPTGYIDRWWLARHHADQAE